MKANPKNFPFIRKKIKTKLTFTKKVTSNNHPTFEEHINYLYRTANNKVHALRIYRILRKYLPLDKAKNLCFALSPDEFLECV